MSSQPGCPFQLNEELTPQRWIPAYSFEACAEVHFLLQQSAEKEIFFQHTSTVESYKELRKIKTQK